MSIPKPPFHTASEELLYNIYLSLQNNNASMNLDQINTLAKLNVILTDADLMSVQDINNAFLALKGNVSTDGDTLEKLFGLYQGLAASVANLVNTAIFSFNSDLFTEQALAFKGLIHFVSSDLTDDLQAVSYQSSLDVNPKVWIAHTDFVALQAWIDNAIIGDHLTGTKYWIRCLATYKAGRSGQAQSLLYYK